jgi:FtsP/CotA-like multicopper oxidase with cupredoxin domain
MGRRSSLCLALLGLAACKPSLQQRLLGEFAGSYPREASPAGALREFTLVAAPAELPLLEGKGLKVWAYNGQVPGPTLRVKLGDTVHVHFTNQLPQPTTIHWHGIRVPNAMDGVPHGTQAPIEPGQSFDYVFTPKDVGTYWYHPHVRGSEQQERGLYGLVVVEDRDPPPYSQDVTWVLDDWLLGEDGQIFPEFNTRHDLMHDGRWGNVITVNGHTGPLLTAKPGERIRLRLLDSANGRVFVPDFGALEPKVIAVDGLYLREPIPLRGFELAPGNRLDLDLTLPNVSGTFPVIDRFIPARPNLLATIQVDGAPAATPTFASPAHAHVPAWTDALASPVDQTFHIDARRGGRYGIEWTFNGQAVDMDGMDHMAPGTAMPPLATFQQGHFYHLRFVNDSYRLHPIHLHGMFFRLLARDGKPVDEPFFRDTVLIHRKETVDLGVVPEDVGLWMMHCHILEHAEAGMMAFLKVTPHG